MKRLLDLHSKFRTDKAELKRRRRDLGIQQKNSLLLLKIEYNNSLNQAIQVHQRVLQYIKDECSHKLQTIHIREREETFTPEELRNLEQLRWEACSEAWERRDKENKIFRNTEETISKNYIRRMKKLEETYNKEYAEMEIQRADIITKFDADQQKLFDTYRREKAEKGGEA